MHRHLIPCLALLLSLGFAGRGLAADAHGHDHGGKDHDHAEHADHDEKPPHGGILREVGETHLELVTAIGGVFTLYLYDGDLKPKQVPAKPLTLQVKPTGATSLVPVTLAPSGAEKADTFTGTVASLATATGFEATLRIELDGTAQRIVFAK